MNASSEKKVVTTDRPRRQPNRKGAADPYTGRCLACPLSDRPRNAEEELLRGW
jgi:hypothetical protein